MVCQNSLLGDYQGFQVSGNPTNCASCVSFE
jgi:hypothetical protein